MAKDLRHAGHSHCVTSASTPTAFFLAGPTASGKSRLAAKLAAAIGGEVVNADAFQLYRGLDILTAKPDAQTLSLAPHHLFGLLDGNVQCDAQQYVNLALPVLEDIVARGRWPIVVGGSGLYLRALSHGLDPLPAADAALRAQLGTLPLPELVARLLKLDPAAGAQVSLLNPRYVQRALELCMLTGKPLAELRPNNPKPARGPGLRLDCPRPLLWQRIEARAQAMLNQGLLEEIQRAGAVTGGLAKAIGLAPWRAHLQGELPHAQALDAMILATRQYAKRQDTWFRREGWMQTICLEGDAGADCLLPILLEQFPCLNQAP